VAKIIATKLPRRVTACHQLQCHGYLMKMPV